MMIFFHMNLQTSLLVMTTSDSTHLVKQSTTINKKLHCPVAFGKGPKMSMPYFAKGNGECIVEWMDGDKGVNSLALVTFSNHFHFIEPECVLIVIGPQCLYGQAACLNV